MLQAAIFGAHVLPADSDTVCSVTRHEKTVRRKGRAEGA